jgi:hypothetical protein
MKIKKHNLKKTKSNLILFSIWLITIICLEACFVKNTNHSSFWESFFSNQQLLIDKYADTDLYPILFGSLRPEEEKLLYKKGDNLYLSGYVTKQGNNLTPKIDNKDLPAANDEYFTNIEYTKSEFKGRPTYKIKRKTSFKYPTYTMKKMRPTNSKVTVRIIGSSVISDKFIYLFIIISINIISLVIRLIGI